MAEVVDHHRRQRARDPLAGRQQHVHLARVRARRRPRGPSPPARRWSCRARRARPPRGCRSSAACDDAPRGALDALGVGDRGAAELHHHRLGQRLAPAWPRQVSVRARCGMRRSSRGSSRWSSAWRSVAHRARRGDRGRSAAARRATATRSRRRVPEAGGRDAEPSGDASFLARVVPPPAEPRGDRPARACRARVRRPGRGGCRSSARSPSCSCVGFEGQDLTVADLPPAPAARPGRDGDRAPQLHRPAAARARWPARPRVIAAPGAPRAAAG